MEEKKQINITVGKNIKREREKAGYTQEKFSELIGIGPKSLSAIERGTVGVSLLLLTRITNILGVSADVLLFTDPKNNDTDEITRMAQKLSPKQFRIVKDVLYKLLEAFAISDNQH